MSAIAAGESTKWLDDKADQLVHLLYAAKTDGLFSYKFFKATVIKPLEPVKRRRDRLA